MGLLSICELEYALKVNSSLIIGGRIVKVKKKQSRKNTIIIFFAKTPWVCSMER